MTMVMAMEQREQAAFFAAADEARVAILRTRTEVERVAPDWEVLVRQPNSPASAFQTPQWALSVIDQQGGEPGGLRVVTVRDDQGLALIAPLALMRRGPFRVGQWLGEPLSGYGDIVIRQGCDAAALMRKALVSLRRQTAVDVLYLRKVRQDAALMPFLWSLGGHPVGGNRGPFVDFRDFNSFDDYLATRAGSALKGYRRKRRRLEELGPLVFRVHGPGPRAKELGRHALELKIKWMETYGKISRAFADTAYLDALVEMLGREGSGAWLSELSIGDKPIALEIGLVCNKRYYSYLGAMDMEYYRYSPGNLQLLETLRWCYEEGIEIFDFLPSDTEYKRSWSTDVAPENEWILTFGFKGALYEHLVVKGLLSFSRRTFSRVPLALRRPARHLIHGLLRR